MPAPIYQGQIDEIKRMLRDLEERLKNENVPLGHRSVFAVGKKGEVPAPTAEDRDAGKVLGVTGWVTGSGGGGGLSTVYVDGLTIGGDGSAAYPLSASLLSGTINARFATFVSGSGFLSGVAHDATLTGNGTSGSPLSAYPALLLAASGSQRFTYSATGGEGNAAGVNLPIPFAGPQYSVYLTKVSGSGVGAYSVPVAYRTSSSFVIYSTQPFQSTDKIDVLAVTASFGPMGDTSSFANISGSFASSVVTGLANLSGTINSAIVALSGTIARRDIDLSGTIDGHFNQLSGTINARFAITTGGGAFGATLGSAPTSANTGLSSWFNQPTSATAVDEANGLVIYCPNQGFVDNQALRYVAAPVTASYTVTACVAITHVIGQNSGGGIGFSNSTNIASCKREQFGFKPFASISDSWYVGKYTDATTFSGYVAQTNWYIGPTLLWIRLAVTSTTVSYQYSSCGAPGTWITYATVTKAGSHLGSSGYTYIIVGAFGYGSEASIQLLSWAVA